MNFKWHKYLNTFKNKYSMKRFLAFWTRTKGTGFKCGKNTKIH